MYYVRMVSSVIDKWTINATSGWLVRGGVMRERVSSSEGYIMECKAVSKRKRNGNEKWMSRV